MSKEQMAWAFEQLDLDVPLKSIAIDVGADVSTVSREIYQATAIGFAAWHPRHSKPRHKKCTIK